MQSYNSRLLWMDFVRGVFILLVLMLHACALIAIHGLTVPDSVELFNGIFEPFRMPVLIFLSGLLLERSLRKSAKPFIAGKAKYILWPYVVWSLITMAAMDAMSMRKILLFPIIPQTFLWYLWFLAAFYIGGLIVKRLNIPVLLVIFTSLLAAYFLPDIARMSRFAFLFSFFMLGYLVSITSIDEILKSRFFPLIGVLLATIGAYLSISGVQVRYEALYFWAPIGLIFSMLWASKYYVPSTFGGIVESVGRTSIVFYVSHYSFQWLVAKYLVVNGLNNFWIAFFLVFLSTIAFGWLLTFLRKKYYIVSLLFELPTEWKGALPGRVVGSKALGQLSPKDTD